MQSVVLSQREIKFLGHIISETGVKSDPVKTAAIREMTVPTNTSGFLEMVNQLVNFIQHLRDLFSKKNH